MYRSWLGIMDPWGDDRFLEDNPPSNGLYIDDPHSHSHWWPRHEYVAHKPRHTHPEWDESLEGKMSQFDALVLQLAEEDRPIGYALCGGTSTRSISYYLRVSGAQIARVRAKLDEL